MPNKITVEKSDHILMIGLNRVEKMNAADEELLTELSLAYGELDRNPELRVGLVFAHGDHFTAGLDLIDLGPKLATGNLQLVPEGGLDPWGVTTRQVSKPVVMAIQGTCYTLGVELALASDIVVAAENSKFAQLEVARGIMPFGGATLRFGRVAGHANAMRYLLTADSFDAQEAHRLGLVTEVVAVGEQLERAMALAERISAQAPLAVQATLASARANPETEAAEIMPRLGALLRTKDVQRGLEAFMTRQPAKFEGN
jgi:enoyl-CoA hydratase/carnithine racemase